MAVLRSEIVAVLVFVAAVGAVYAWSGVALLIMLVRRIWGRPNSRRRPVLMWVNRVVLALAGVGVLCGVYSLIEPYWPQVTTVQVPTARLPRGAKPIRIVHLSDIHSDAAPRLEERLPGIVADLKPDLILFTGDAANSKKGVATFNKLMAALSRIAPVYGVRGNWEYNWNEPTLIEGGTELRGLAKVNVHGNDLYLVGAPCFQPRMMHSALEAVPADKPVVMLYHFPDEAAEFGSTGKVDLYLCGHTHGGQVALPVYGALVTLGKYGKRYERDMVYENGMAIHISRGIGMEGHFPARMRFFSRPDVTLIELVPAER